MTPPTGAFFPSTPGSRVEGEGAEEKCVFNEEFKFVLLPVSYGAVCVVGLLLNSYSLWVFVFRMRPWNATTTYMFNLAVSDTLYLLSLPTLVYYYADRNNWPFGEPLCKGVRFLFYANLYSSILFLSCISAHRYVGVCHPIRALRWVKTRHARLLCLGVWLAVAACLVPNLVFVTVSARGNDTLCHDTTKPAEFDRYVYYSSAVMVLLFGLPSLVTGTCYCLMARRLRRRPGGVGSGHGVPAYKRRSVRTIVVVLSVFAVCFLPFHVTRTLYYTARLLRADCATLNAVNVAYKATRPLASANSCLDPVLYFLAGDAHRGRRGRRRALASPPKPTLASTLALVSQAAENDPTSQGGSRRGEEEGGRGSACLNGAGP